MIYLPRSPGRLRLKSFLVVSSAFFGAVVAILSYGLGQAHWVFFGGAATLGFSLLGFIRPANISLAYRGYNKLARLYGRYVENLILILSFCVMHLGIGKKQGHLTVPQPQVTQSAWVVNDSKLSSSGPPGFGVTSLDSQSKSWVASYTRWAASSGNWWMLALLPYLFLLSFLAQEKREEDMMIPTNLYTLY